ncbi:hypothetical protein BJV77DRAFT_729065 [Russula vinacea]|nr:hypothetical protein BJV77DRAFT_729065 [Russula vinacea]
MTNFNDFAVQQADFFALQKFWHTVNGLYIWEYVTNLDFEYDVIRGRRPYRWTIWIYVLARFATLMAIVLNFIDFNVGGPVNCQALITLETGFGYLGLVTASLLVILRIIAIWERNKFVKTVAIIVWLVNVIAVIQGVARLRATWIPLMQTCVVINSEEIKPNIIITLITDVFLLVTVLVGLLLSDGSRSFGLGRLIWKQGVLWLLIAAATGVPPTVFISLNLDIPFNLMFQLPSVITMTIAATRTYRSLLNFAGGSTNITLENISNNVNKVSKIQWNNSAPISIDGVKLLWILPTRRHWQHTALAHNWMTTRRTRRVGCRRRPGK